MEDFQSWTTVITSFALLLAAILWIVPLKRENKILKSTIKELEAVNKSSLSATENSFKSLEVYMKTVDVNDLYKHFEWKVERAALNKLDSYMHDAVKEILTKEKLLELAIKTVEEEYNPIVGNHFKFLMYCIVKNKMNEEKIKQLVKDFFDSTPQVYDTIMDWLPKFEKILFNKEEGKP